MCQLRERTEILKRDRENLMELQIESVTVTGC